MRLLTLAAAALAALLLTIALANAQEPPEPQTATRLEPGINLVGWVGEPTSTSQLFDEIPQLEAIWAWDAELDDWIVAGRGAPEWVGGLGRVWAGTGLRLVLSGEEPFLWQRPTEPTSGLVELRTGWNLVAWSGADGAPLEQVAKGIGWSLRELRRWDAANQRWTTWTSPERSTQLIATSATDQAATDEEAEPVTVRRGEALWVNTARSVNWLQPTDILPRLVFPGGASDELQAHVREDLESVLAFYGQQYGIQAEPDFTIYVAKDADALIQAQKDDGDELDAAREASIRALWNSSGGWARGGGRIVVKQASWPEDLSISEIAQGRYWLTHEYFHILQRQLSDSWASKWLVEGTADWVEGGHQVLDGEQTLEAQRERTLSELSPRTPTLRSAEQENDQWEYTLGWLAVDRLTAAAGDESYIEFWRRLASTEIGPHGRWTSRPGWRTAFQETFGVSVSSFYADFNTWQREQAAMNGSAASSSNDDGHWVRGRITDAGGAPAVGVFVNAIRVEGETSVGWNRRAETDADGRFAVRAPEEGDYRISADIADDCTRYYRNSSLTEDPDEALLVTVAGSDRQGVNIQLPANICGWLIRGRVADATGEPFAGASITICETTTHTCTWNKSTNLDGSFAISAPTAGEYHLRLDLTDHCEVYFRTAGVALSSSDASLITVAGTDVDGLTLRVPDNVCAYQISGTIIGADGAPLTETWVRACEQVNDKCASSTSDRTDSDGSFAITVPVNGAYRLSFSLDGCTVYFGQGRLTSNVGDAWLTRVAGREVQLSQRQVPSGLCSQQISGRLVNATGEPLAQASISICQLVGDECATWLWGTTDADGSFAVTVPAAGAYRLSFNLNGCSIYYRTGSLTTRQTEASRINVTESESPNLQLRVPEGMCAYQITGSVTKADGQPLADTYIGVVREVNGRKVGRVFGQNTGIDGSFAITAPSEAAYNVSFSLGGCWLYFSAGGITPDWDQRLLARVSDRDLQLGHRQIPAELCAHRISGRFVDANGAPLADKGMNVCHTLVDHSACAPVRTTADGRFTIRVPRDDSYRFDVWLTGDCNRRPEGRALGSRNNPVRVSGADVTDIVLRLPGTVEELCG